MKSKTASDPQPAPGRDETYLTGAQVRARYGGVSSQWLWRRAHDQSDFPRPLNVGARKFWALSKILAWEQSKAIAAE